MALPQRALLIPYAAGSGAADAIGRIVAERLHEEWRRPVVVENVPGASGSIGIGRLVRETPDGYTIAIAGDAPISVNVHLRRTSAMTPFAISSPSFKSARRQTSSWFT